MRKKTKKKLQVTAIILVSLMVIGALLYSFGIFQNAYSGVNCNLGYWNINSYDSSTKTATIPINIGKEYAGGLCPYFLTSPSEGTSAFKTQDSCESFGLNWNEEEGICFLGNENWFDDKTYTSSVVCEHSINKACAKPNPEDFVGSGCVYGFVTDESIRFQDYEPSFDGGEIKFKDLRRQGDDVVTCSGVIFVKQVVAGSETTEEEETATTTGETEETTTTTEESTPDVPETSGTTGGTTPSSTSVVDKLKDLPEEDKPYAYIGMAVVGILIIAVFIGIYLLTRKRKKRRKK